VAKQNLGEVGWRKANIEKKERNYRILGRLPQRKMFGIIHGTVVDWGRLKLKKGEDEGGGAEGVDQK